MFSSKSQFYFRFSCSYMLPYMFNLNICRFSKWASQLLVLECTKATTSIVIFSINNKNAKHKKRERQYSRFEDKCFCDDDARYWILEYNINGHYVMHLYLMVEMELKQLCGTFWHVFSTVYLIFWWFSTMFLYLNRED